MKAQTSSIAQVVTACAAAIAVLYFFRTVLAPFFLAVVVAIIVDAISDGIRHVLPMVPRWAAVLLVGVVAAALVVVGFGVVIHAATGLIPQADKVVSRLQDLLQTVETYLGLPRAPDLRTLLATADVSGSFRAATAATAQALSTVGLIVLFLAFLLVSRVTLNSKVEIIAASPSKLAHVYARLELILRGVQARVLMQAIGAGLTAIASGLVLAAVGLQDALFWTIAIFLVLYLPIIGGLLASLVPALFALAQFPTAWQAVVVFAAIQSINFVIDNVVMPKLNAKGVNVDPTAGFVIFCMLEVLWGLPGAILAGPLTVMLMLILADFDRTRWLAVLISNNGLPGGSVGRSMAPTTPLLASSQ